MHAFLMTGPKEENLNYCMSSAKKHKANIIPTTLQKIDDVRSLKSLVKLSFSQKTAVLIENIDTATPEAQNAFLKNLEEPQNNLIYFLTSKNIHNVLPTIQSRCQVINTGHKIHTGTSIKDKVENKVVLQFLKSGIDIKFDILNKIKDRGEAVAFVESLIFIEREQKTFKNMKAYLNTLKNLKANGNISLQLTNMLVSS